MTDRTWTEADVLAALADRHSDDKGWAFLTHVRSETGASGAGRTADAIAMQLWPSRGLELHGFEVKVTRSDLLRELKDPVKAEEIARYCHRWWLAVPRGLCDLGEVPPAWGLYEIDGRGVSTTKPAEPRSDVTPVGYSFLASLLRNGTRVDGLKTVLDRARTEAHREGIKVGLAQAENRNGTARYRDELEQMRERLATFEAAAGIDLENLDRFAKPPELLGEAFRVATDDLVALQRLELRRDQLRDQCRRLVEVLAEGPS